MPDYTPEQYAEVEAHLRGTGRMTDKLAASMLTHLQAEVKRLREDCEACGGSGVIEHIDQVAHGDLGYQEVVTGHEKCPPCGGTGKGEMSRLRTRLDDAEKGLREADEKFDYTAPEVAHRIIRAALSQYPEEAEDG